MKVYAGIDLHANNNYVGVINEEDQRLYQSKRQSKPSSQRQLISDMMLP
jgi:hypothetical protein